MTVYTVNKTPQEAQEETLLVFKNLYHEAIASSIPGVNNIVTRGSPSAMDLDTPSPTTILVLNEPGVTQEPTPTLASQEPSVPVPAAPTLQPTSPNWERSTFAPSTEVPPLPAPPSPPSQNQNLPSELENETNIDENGDDGGGSILEWWRWFLVGVILILMLVAIYYVYKRCGDNNNNPPQKGGHANINGEDEDADEEETDDGLGERYGD